MRKTTYAAGNMEELHEKCTSPHLYMHTPPLQGVL